MPSYPLEHWHKYPGPLFAAMLWLFALMQAWSLGVSFPSSRHEPFLMAQSAMMGAPPWARSFINPRLPVRSCCLKLYHPAKGGDRLGICSEGIAEPGHETTLGSVLETPRPREHIVDAELGVKGRVMQSGEPVITIGDSLLIWDLSGCLRFMQRERERSFKL